VAQIAKLSFLLATLIGLGFNFPALIDAGQINWLGWLLAYAICFAFFYFYLPKETPESEEYPEEIPGSVSPAQLESLYKQAMIVERNAQKADKVFSQQLEYVNKLVQKTKKLSPGPDFDAAHASLVKELDILEHHVERLLEEMQKNVKLGGRLLQSVANIDPEIGVI